MTNPVLDYCRLFLRDRVGNDYAQECLSLIEALEDAKNYTTQDVAQAQVVLLRLALAAS